jgi:C1A family cysteine protease
MKTRSIFTIAAGVILLAAASSFLFASQNLERQQAGPIRPMPGDIGKGGFIPPPVYMHHLHATPERLMAMPQAPVAWDWRTSGDVTPVKDQNPYGTCWAFASIGCLESALHIQQGLTRNYSEYNVVSCADNRFYDLYGYNCDVGGNAFIAANYLSLLGAINESMDVYPGSCPWMTGCYDATPFLQVNTREFRAITGDPPVTSLDEEAIKNAVMTYGPVITSMYSSWSEFHNYDTDTCLTYPGTESPDHSVLIVGWNDTLCGGEGAWIVKNSWGTSWGDAGYFYIKYGQANIGSYSGVISRYRFHDDREKIYYLDEYGYNYYAGWADDTDWGMIEYTPDWSGFLRAVDIWTTSEPCNYRIIVYDDFTGGSLQNPLGGPYDGSLQEAGFYSIDLPESIDVVYNDPVFIAVRFNTPGWNGCLPHDHYGTMETDRSWGSNNGTAWEAQDQGYNNFGDLCIRGRVIPECTIDVPKLDIRIIGTEVVTLGMNDFNRFWVEVHNRSDVPSELFEPAPDLYPYTPDNSRGNFEIQNAFNWAALKEFGELDSSNELDSLYFDVWTALSPPDSVVIMLQDRRCFVSYGSSTARVPATTCGQPVLTEAGYNEVSWNDPLWEIEAGLENTGIRIAYNVSATLRDGPAWLTIVDSTADYGLIPLDVVEFGGGDTYTLEMSAYPGGPFTVTLGVEYEDVCGTPYQVDVPIELERSMTGIETPPIDRVRLLQNYPNPFNPNTTIRYELPEGCHVRLAVYDVAGRLVRILVDDQRAGGVHDTVWNGMDSGGLPVASGIYFYRLDAARAVITKKMALLR